MDRNEALKMVISIVVCSSEEFENCDMCPNYCGSCDIKSTLRLKEAVEILLKEVKDNGN